MLTELSRLLKISFQYKKKQLSGKTSNKMLHLDEDTVFSGCPLSARQKQAKVEDVLCPKLPAPVFTENLETADLCLGCE